MLKLSGSKLVKFLYQHQDTKKFEDIKLKIKHHKRFSKFSIDDIYVFLLLYAPHQILKNKQDETLKFIFLDILSKAPKLTHHNFQIPGHIPFLAVEKEKIERTQKPFIVILDELGYYASKVSQIFSSARSMKITHVHSGPSINIDHIKSLYYTNSRKNRNSRPHPLLKGIKKIVNQHYLYNSSCVPTILNTLVPYSSSLLKTYERKSFPFGCITKRNYTLLNYRQASFESILYLANIKSSKKQFQYFLFNNLSNPNNQITKIREYLQDENYKDIVARLFNTPMISNVIEKHALSHQHEKNPNRFEYIYEHCPKQTIIDHQSDAYQHYKSLKCIDYFMNIKDLTNIQTFSLADNLNISHSFEILDSHPVFHYFYENNIAIFEILSSYTKQQILTLIERPNIKYSLMNFFLSIDEHLASCSKDFLLSNLIEVCIHQNIWKPTYLQLLIFQNHLNNIISQEELFITLPTSKSIAQNKLEIIETLLFEIELENYAPHNEDETQHRLIKY